MRGIPAKCYMLFLPAVLCRRGGFKMGMAGRQFLCHIPNFLANSAKYDHCRATILTF